MFISHHMSRVTCHLSCVMCHVSHVTCHSVTCHMYFFIIFFYKVYGATRWRVCYQHGVPRLVLDYTRYILFPFVVSYEGSTTKPRLVRVVLFPNFKFHSKCQGPTQPCWVEARLTVGLSWAVKVYLGRRNWPGLLTLRQTITWHKPVSASTSD